MVNDLKPQIDSQEDNISLAEAEAVAPQKSENMMNSFFKEKEKNGEPIVHIFANIYCMRASQKGILLGKGGQSIKELGISSRKAIESYIGKRVHLELYIKIKDKWRDNDYLLKSFGYLH